MNFTIVEPKTVKLEPGDDGFTLVDNLFVVQRAAIEISKQCPDSYALIIAEALRKGWIKPVAYIKRTEQIFDRLENS